MNNRLRFTVLFAAALLFLAAAFSTQIFKNTNQSKQSSIINKNATDSAQKEEIQSKEEKSEAKSNENNSSNGNASSGTCTITKNGVTTIVPSDQVNVNEKSSGDVSVKVNCSSSSNSTSSTNGKSYSNNSSVETHINIESNTHN